MAPLEPDAVRDNRDQPPPRPVVLSPAPFRQPPITRELRRNKPR